MKWRNSQRLNALASSMRIITRVSSASNTRGGAKWKVGPISRKSSAAVAGAFGAGHDRSRRRSLARS